MLIKLPPSNSWLIEPFSTIEITAKDDQLQSIFHGENIDKIRNRIVQILCENFHTMTDEGAGGITLLDLKDHDGNMIRVEIAWQTFENTIGEMAA